MNEHIYNQLRDIKGQSIDGLRQLCENMANARNIVDGYSQNYIHINNSQTKETKK